MKMFFAKYDTFIDKCERIKLYDKDCLVVITTKMPITTSGGEDMFIAICGRLFYNADDQNGDTLLRNGGYNSVFVGYTKAELLQAHDGYTTDSSNESDFMLMIESGIELNLPQVDVNNTEDIIVYDPLDGSICKTGRLSDHYFERTYSNLQWNYHERCESILFDCAYYDDKIDNIIAFFKEENMPYTIVGEKIMVYEVADFKKMQEQLQNPVHASNIDYIIKPNIYD